MAGEGKGLADREGRRSGVPKRALIAPLVMLVGGAAASVALWRFLMVMPASTRDASEHLSTADRRALDGVLRHVAPE